MLTPIKELYEPLWDELLKISKQHSFGIRGIWIADVVHQGQSSVLNEEKLGNDRRFSFRPVYMWQSFNVHSGMARS